MMTGDVVGFEHHHREFKENLSVGPSYCVWEKLQYISQGLYQYMIYFPSRFFIYSK